MNYVDRTSPELDVSMPFGCGVQISGSVSIIQYFNFIYLHILHTHPPPWKNMWTKLFSIFFINSLWAGWSGDRIPVGGRFSAPLQTRSGAHLASYTMGTVSFPGGKEAGKWRWPPTTSSAEVKERVKLYPLFPLGLRGLFWGELYLYLPYTFC